MQAHPLEFPPISSRQQNPRLDLRESFAAQHRASRIPFRRLRPPTRGPIGVSMQQLLNVTRAGFARAVCFGFTALASVAAMSSRAVAANVTTYHYDNQRTGWNSNERTLTPNTVLNGLNGKTFKLMATAALDDQ